jgi:hypothetical protein
MGGDDRRHLRTATMNPLTLERRPDADRDQSATHGLKPWSRAVAAAYAANLTTAPTGEVYLAGDDYRGHSSGEVIRCSTH